MRALVTGGAGFVGGYLQKRLREDGHDVIVAGRLGDACDVVLELNDGPGISKAISIANPDWIFHLAAQTFVPAAQNNPLETYDTNVMGTARLLFALAEHCKEYRRDIKVIFASSSQVYGRGRGDRAALAEGAPARPVEPYGASKAAAESVCLAAQAGIEVVIARAFNHIGAGQDPRFVVPSFALQLATIAQGGKKPLVEVGNLEAERDFLDVRDVVDAYVVLAERGLAGDTYNVCSGQPIPIKSMLRMLILEANVPVEVREDPARMRSAEIPCFYGDNQKLGALGWAPKISIQQSLREIYADALRTVTTTA